MYNNKSHIHPNCNIKLQPSNINNRIICISRKKTFWWSKWIREQIPNGDQLQQAINYKVSGIYSGLIRKSNFTNLYINLLNQLVRGHLDREIIV